MSSRGADPGWSGTFLRALRGLALLALGFSAVVVIQHAAAPGVFDERRIDPFFVILIYWGMVPYVALVLATARRSLHDWRSALATGWVIMFPCVVVTGMVFRPGMTGLETAGVGAVLSLILAGAYLPRIRRFGGWDPHGGAGRS